MPSITPGSTKLYLCADAGGTALKVAVLTEKGEYGFATGPPCNVKSVGSQVAIRNILQTTWKALQNLETPLLLPVNKVDPEPLHLELFERVWLGIAGILRQEEVDEFRPLATEAFGFEADDERLRITNDGHLLAAPAVSQKDIESTVVLVAGTGSVSLGEVDLFQQLARHAEASSNVAAFKKNDTDLELVGISGGWGFLIGDEGSAFHVGRLAMRQLMLAADAQPVLSSSTSYPLLPIFASLLSRLKVSTPAEMIDKIYSDHSNPSSPSSFSEAETQRKLWIADSSRVVFQYAFDDPSDDQESRRIALSILEEAVGPLVEATLRLIGDRSTIQSETGSLSLGGGLWNSEGYKDMLLEKLRAKGVEFAQVAIVKSAAEEGVKALLALDQHQ
ncbi:hypothetical protein JCM5353_000360 [Sporobolomyces roseus]